MDAPSPAVDPTASAGPPASAIVPAGVTDASPSPGSPAPGVQAATPSGQPSPFASPSPGAATVATPFRTPGVTATIPAETASPAAERTAPAASTEATLPSPSPAGSGRALPSPTSTLLPAPGGGTSSVIDGATERKLRSIMRLLTVKRRIAGVQIAVRAADGQTWLGEAGYADFDPDRLVRSDTVFSIASVSKTFIAALILQLAEEDKLDLDVPYGRYLTAGPRSENVTIRQLLSHTSGIYDYFENPRYTRITEAWLKTTSGDGLSGREHLWTYDEIMELVKPRSGYCKPGTCYRYSNTNYVILGRIAELVADAPLHKQLRKRFFRPLGMADTYYQPAEVPPADAAHGHWGFGGSWSDHTRSSQLRPFTAAVSVANAAGSVASTAHDLAIWADALYGGHVLSAESLVQMTTSMSEGAYGLGTDIAVWGGHRAWGHNGGLRGFDSAMWYYPETGVTIVMLSSQGNWLTADPLDRLARAVLGRR